MLQLRKCLFCDMKKFIIIKSRNCLYATSIYCFVLLSSSSFFFFLRRFRILLLKLVFGAWVPVWPQRSGILVPGRPFGHAGGYFGSSAPVWARGRAIWCPTERMFQYVGGHFEAQVPIWACGRAFFCLGVHLGMRAGTVWCPGAIWVHGRLPV